MDFIEKNNYDVGYAFFWQANVVTMATNGSIPMIFINYGNPDSTFIYGEWLTNKQLHQRSVVNEKNVFLLLETKEEDTFKNHERYNHATLVYKDQYYIVYGFDSSTILWDHLLIDSE